MREYDYDDAVAFLWLGQFWCPEHCEYDQEDIDQSYVVPLFKPDMDRLEDLGYAPCCHVCGTVF
jgi:hypothetical protein